jgi:hypothetical protein
MKRTEYIDDDGKVYSLPVFEMMDPESLRQKKERQVFDAIVESMVQLKETGLDQVPCFILGDLVFSMSRDSVVDNLDSCLEYYTSIEEYEICQKIMVLLPYLKT